MTPRATRGLDALLRRRGRRLRRMPPSGPMIAEEWRWDLLDQHYEAWWPQGVETFRHDERELLLVSWFLKRSGQEAATRITVVDPARGRYHHVLVLEQSGKPVAVHAGGIALLGDELHLADTGHGRRVIDLDDIATSPWWRRRAGGTASVVERGRRPRIQGEDRRIRHSFLAVDRGDPAASEPGLTVGEYRLDTQGVLALADADGARREQLVPGIDRMQGAVRLPGGRWLVTASRHLDPGDLWLGDSDGWTRLAGALPPGPEDLAASADGGRVYSLSEFPGARSLFRLDLDAVDRATAEARRAG